MEKLNAHTVYHSDRSDQPNNTFLSEKNITIKNTMMQNEKTHY